MGDEGVPEVDASPVDLEDNQTVIAATDGNIISVNNYYVSGASNSVINVNPTVLENNADRVCVPPNVRAQMDAELKLNAGIFQQTSGFNNCLETLRKYGSVVVSANPGDGKTMVAAGIARHLRDIGWGDGSKCIPLILKTPEDWRRYVDPTKSQIILIDDMFGSHNLSKDMLNQWLSFLYMVEACLSEFAGRLFVVITCRKTVLVEAKEDVKKFQLFDSHRIVNLSADENLTMEDMKRLIVSHKNRAKVELLESQIDQIVVSCKRQGFPRTCGLLVRCGADPDKLEAQFQNPTDILMDELQLIFRSPLKKALLYLLVFCDGNLDISGTNLSDGNLPWYERILDLVGLPTSTPFVHLTEKVSKIPESYVVVEDEGMTKRMKFSHPSVFCAVARLFSKSNLACLVQYSSMKLLSDLIRLEKDGKQDTSITITMKQSDIIILIDRFIAEILQGNCRPVFSHDAFSSVRFVELFLDVARKRNLLKQILPRDKKTQLSLLYWSVWNKRGILCRSILQIANEPKSKIKFDDQDRFNAIVGAFQSGNIEALTSLLPTFSAKVLKKCFQKMLDQRPRQCHDEQDWQSLLDLACRSKKEEAVNLILQHQREELDSKDVAWLLSILAATHDCDMFLYVFEKLPSEILQTTISIITLPRAFKDHIARIVKILCKQGAETQLTVTIVNYSIQVLTWKPYAKFTEIHDEELHVGTYTVKLIPRINLYARRKEGYCPQTVMYKLALAGRQEIVELMILLGTDPNQESREHGETVLIACCRQNLLHIVECLLKFGADVNLPSGKEKQTPILLATEMGNHELVSLLAKHANVDIRSGNYFTTPLIVALEKDDKKCVNVLLQNGASVNLSSKSNKETPLSIACSKLDVTMVITLVKAGADVNQESGFSHETPLVKACGMWNSGAIVKILVESGADVDKASRHTKTLPLHLACKHGNSYAVQCLLEHGATLPVGDEFTDTLLNTACRVMNTEMAQILIDHGEDNVNKKSGPQNEAPLLIACTKSDTSMVKCLLQNGADVNIVSGHHNISPLHMTCSSGIRNIVSILLSAGADVNTKRDMDQLTPLYVACLRKVDLIDDLLQRGADVNMLNGKHGETVLHLASSKGESVIIRKLIGKGADVNMKSGEFNETLLYAACKNRHFESAKILVSSGADVNNKNGCYRENPVYAACVVGDLRILEYLLQKDAEVNTINGQACETPLSYLCYCAHTDATNEWGFVNCHIDVLQMVRLLIKYGAKVNIPGGPDLLTPLAVAEARADVELVAILRNCGAE